MDGILIVNKPKGYTSHDIVNIIRKKLNIKKVGHTGTLDPNATGVLPILIGNATKISKYLIEHDKTYIVLIKLGQKTDTGDIEGNIIKKESNKISYKKEEEIKEILTSFIGKNTQIPPIYSAIKVNGKKLYEYARNGQDINIAPREIEIYNIKLISLDKVKENLQFEVTCSKGTYIRVLCEDIAEALGTVGYMEELIRTKVDKFDIEGSIKLEEINIENVNKYILPIENCFLNKEKIELNDKNLDLLLNGVKLEYKLSDELYRIYNKNIFIGLAVIKNGFLKRDVIIH